MRLPVFIFVASLFSANCDYVGGSSSAELPSTASSVNRAPVRGVDCRPLIHSAESSSATLFPVRAGTVWAFDHDESWSSTLGGGSRIGETSWEFGAVECTGNAYSGSFEERRTGTMTFNSVSSPDPVIAVYDERRTLSFLLSDDGLLIHGYLPLAPLTIQEAAASQSQSMSFLSGSYIYEATFERGIGLMRHSKRTAPFPLHGGGNVNNQLSRRADSD